MSNYLPILGSRVLVAGGSRGIGLGIALALLKAGARVSICARSHDGLVDAQQLAAQRGFQLHTRRCDLADPAQIDAWVHEGAEALGGIDTVVNNASGFAASSDEESWQSSLQIDLMAAVRTNQAALRWLRRSHSGCILNVSSINALKPTPRTAAYSTAKAALNYYTQSLAAELARERIRVNALAPGSIEFPGGLWEQRRESAPELYRQIEASIPFGGFGSVEAVADAALFLCSPASRWITGQVLVVDGGQMLPA